MRFLWNFETAPTLNSRYVELLKKWILSYIVGLQLGLYIQMIKRHP